MKPVKLIVDCRWECKVRSELDCERFDEGRGRSVDSCHLSSEPVLMDLDFERASRLEQQRRARSLVLAMNDLRTVELQVHCVCLRTKLVATTSLCNNRSKGKSKETKSKEHSQWMNPTKGALCPTLEWRAHDTF